MERRSWNARWALVGSLFGLGLVALVVPPARGAGPKAGSGGTEVGGFSVEVSGTGGDVDSAWETCSGGALALVPPPPGATGTTLRVTPLVLRGPLTKERTAVKGSSYEILENGAGRFRIDIVGCPTASANVESISVGDLVIDARELSTGADWDYRVYGPGDAHYGSVTVRARCGAAADDLSSWWSSSASGKGPDRRDIEVVALSRDGTEARRWSFHGCTPLSYAPFELREDGVATETIEARPTSVELTTRSGRKALCQWITETVTGKDSRRTLTVKEILKDGAAGKAFTYLDCFPVRYVFPAFGASGKGPLTEEVDIKPIRLELR